MHALSSRKFAQGLVYTQQVLLADKLFQYCRAQAFGKGSISVFLLP
jgi:hypothetical protein